MDIAPIDDEGRLFLSSDIDDWPRLRELGIQLVVDLDAPADQGMPERATQGEFLYVYFPIHDGELPDLDALRATGRMSAALHRLGWRILVHCELGFNRSALLAGVILHELGWDGPAAIERLRERRPGALFNEVFDRYVRGLRAGGGPA